MLSQDKRESRLTERNVRDLFFKIPSNRSDYRIFFLEATQVAPDGVITCSNTMRLDLDKIGENLSHKEVRRCLGGVFEDVYN